MNSIKTNNQAINYLKHYKQGFRDGKNSKVQREDGGIFYRKGYRDGDKYRAEVIAKMHAAIAAAK